MQSSFVAARSLQRIVCLLVVNEIYSYLIMTPLPGTNARCQGATRSNIES